MSLAVENPNLFNRLWSDTPIEDKFPQWITARIIITEWINSICGWEVSFDTVELSTRIAPKSHLILNPPPEDFIRVDEIYTTVMRDFVGEVARNSLSDTMNDFTKAKIINGCEAAEYKKIAATGFGIKASMARAFGINPFRWIGISVRGGA